MNKNGNTIFYYFRTGKIITWQELEDIFAHRIMPQGSLGILNKNQIAKMEGGYIKKIDPPEPKPIYIPEASLIDDSFIEIVNRHHNEMRMQQLREAEMELRRMQEEKFNEEQKRKAYERAKVKSTQGEHVKRTGARKTFRNRMLANALALVLAISVLYGVSNVVSNISDNIAVHNASQNVGELISDGSVHRPDIVSKNSYRTQDNEGFWYNNEDIARDILGLPDELFDTVLYITYEDMGPYTNNMDDVIRALNNYTAGEADKYPIILGKVEGCNSLNDYLIKNGFVNENGEPSIEKFKEHGITQIRVHQEYLEQMAEEGFGTRS